VFSWKHYWYYDLSNINRSEAHNMIIFYYKMTFLSIFMIFDATSFGKIIQTHALTWICQNAPKLWEGLIRIKKYKMFLFHGLGKKGFGRYRGLFWICSCYSQQVTEMPLLTNDGKRTVRIWNRPKRNTIGFLKMTEWYWQGLRV